MRASRVVAVLAAALLAALPSALADLPVHCTQPQVLGRWLLHVGRFEGTPGNHDPRCGYGSPDGEDSHHDLTPPRRDPNNKEAGAKSGYWLSDAFKEDFSMELVLEDWTAAVVEILPEAKRVAVAGSGGNASFPAGMWTMVYDEGFNIALRGASGAVHSLFAFSKYRLREGQDPTSTDNRENAPHSQCNMTLLGWYTFVPDPKKPKAAEHLCYWGELLGPLPDAPVGGGSDRMTVDVTVHAHVQAHVQGPGKVSADLGATVSLHHGGALLEVAPRRRPSRPASAIEERGTVTQEQRTLGGGASVRRFGEALQQRIAEAKARGVPVRFGHDPEKFEEWLRSRGAAASDGREPSTIEELLDSVGSRPLARGLLGFSTEETVGPAQAKGRQEQRQLAQKLGKPLDLLTTEDVQEAWGAATANHHADRKFKQFGTSLGPEDWRTLPVFDWRNVTLEVAGGPVLEGFVAAVPDQGQCGSCYAMASTSMLTSRLMLRYPELRRRWMASGNRVSWHQQMHCNMYVQGCDGGYPELVARWSSEYDFTTTMCEAAWQKGLPGSGDGTANSGRCSSEPSLSSAECAGERFRVRSWRVVGGALGRCGAHHLCEAAIREELYKGGPVVASVEPNAAFWYYNKGLFHPVGEWPPFYTEVPKSSSKECGATECYVWRKIDHSMLIVGWGEAMECQPAEGSTVGANCTGLPEDKCAGACSFRPWKYWVLQNSWTTTWGVGGYMYLGPRGENPLFVESMGMAADPVLTEELDDPSSSSSGLPELRSAGARAARRWARPRP